MTYAYFDRFEIKMTQAQAESASHIGPCDNDVRALVTQLRHQLEQIDPALIAAELAEYGAWETEDLADIEANFERIVWIAACNIREYGEQ